MLWHCGMPKPGEPMGVPHSGRQVDCFGKFTAGRNAGGITLRKASMRTKKAVKQLSKAETLIATVGNRYTQSTPHLRELLDSASAIIAQAKTSLDANSASSAQKSAQFTKKHVRSRGTEAAATPKFTGNKTDFIRALVESRGASGAVPKEIAEVFTARHIDRTDNLIYNALNALVKRKKLIKKADRYFSVSVGSNAKSITPTKQRISPEGLKRTVQANKRRSKLGPAKKGIGPRKARGMKAPARKATA
jgi:hypothetical protein